MRISSPRHTSRSIGSRRLVPVVALSLVFALSACGSSDADEAEATAESIVESDDAAAVVDEAADTADEALASGSDLRAQLDDDSLSTLFSALDAAGFTDIAEAESFTFFAPNDGAFSQLDADTLADLLANPEDLRAILRDHLLESVVMAGDLTDGATATTTGGLELTFDLSDDVPTVNGIPIVRTDLTVDGGVVHVIDGLLLEA
jgi:uncharacterized surface protein with fasciclin (FAS1) repeats